MNYQAQSKKTEAMNNATRAAEHLKFSIGYLVKTARPIDFEPHATITSGQTGRVVDIDSAGWVNVEWDELQWGLAPWENCMWVEEPETCLKVIGKLDTPLAPSRWGRLEPAPKRKKQRRIV
jgi:hypothetical protein